MVSQPCIARPGYLTVPSSIALRDCYGHRAVYASAKHADP
jgi:hypothetical protein